MVFAINLICEGELMQSEEIKNKILELTKNYYKAKFVDEAPKYSYGDRINYGGRVFDETELVNLVDSSLEFWLTSGKYIDEFEKRFAKFLDVKHCSVVNSGSSANLIAFMSLTSHLLGDRQIKKDDEVITIAASFPTTVTPIIQYGAIPVFIDITIPEYNIDISMLENAFSTKTKAIMVAHTLGNPFNLEVVKKFCDKYNLWLIEDNCDALGSKYFYNDNWHYTGTIGDIGTSSFYPPHHITMGEGGAVYTNNSMLNKIINSMRDWGRDCFCKSGEDNSCKNRFTNQYGDLPIGYDHKYVYSHFGYNLKATEMQGAIGVAQLEKIEKITSDRRSNFSKLYTGLKKYDEFLILPKEEENSKASWFGFLLTVKANINRNDLVNFLENKGVQTRTLFAGNLIKQPCFSNLVENVDYKVIGKLNNTDIVLNDSFWIGVYSGITDEKIRYILDSFNEFFMEV